MMRASPIKGERSTTSGAGASPRLRAVDLSEQSQQAANLLKALANPDRLLLLCHLVNTERSVSELGELTGIAQPSLSQQLSVLRAEDLVATRREGKSIFYRIEAPAVHAVLQTLYKIYCEDAQPLNKPKRTRP